MTTFTVDKKKLSDMFAPLRYTPQTFTVEAGKQSRIIGADSTVITFYPNSFRDQQGNTITSGTINIGLIEMLRPGSMIANWTVTQSRNTVLTSGGQVQITATKDGVQVYANKYGIAFPQPAASNQPMELYLGGAGLNNTNASIQTGNVIVYDPTIGWIPFDGAKAGTSAQGTGSFPDSMSISTRSYYLFDSCTTFNYVNCDHPYDGNCQWIAIEFSFPDKRFSPSNTQLVICYLSKNIVLTPKDVNYDPTTNKIRYRGYFPVGIESKLVLMTSDLGKFYYYENSVNAADGLSLTPFMAEKSLDDIRTALKEL